MPTIKDKLNFSYDGIWSNSFGLIHVSLDSSMFEETFVASREIVETKVRGNSKPLYHGLEESPLQFDMVIAFENEYTDDDIDNVVGWLFKNHYRPLYFEGKEDRVYMAMPVGDANIVHTGLKQGYFTITMRCDSSKIYSPTILSDLVTVVGTSTVSIENYGHYEIYPEISIRKNGAGTVTIESLDDDGDIFEVRDLTNQEDIYINCEKEIIETDLIGFYRYDKLVGEFPRLGFGVNRFKVTGDCTIQFRYTKKYKF
jgi:phage-related protein